MASIDWPSGVISILKSDMTLIQSTPSEIYNLDTVQLWQDLRDLEETEDGRMFPRVLDYNPPVTVSGIQLAPVILITDYYTITFEDDQYAVNLIGSNNNIGKQ